jgi:L-amino acid N-acyltransferase YncA
MAYLISWRSRSPVIIGTRKSGIMPQMGTRPPSPWRRTAENLRWRGLWVTVLLCVRTILRPVLYWHVYRIFATDIAKQVPEPYAKEKIETKIHVRHGCPNLEQLDKPLAEVAAMGEISREEAENRLQRGDALAMAYASAEPAGYGWISFSSGVVELAFGVTWIVHPCEAVRYGNFVHPRWRGRGIQSSINTAVNEYARGRGVSITYGSISAMNAQSLSLAEHYNRATAMTVTLILVRPFNWRFCRASGAPFASRFLQ